MTQGGIYGRSCASEVSPAVIDGEPEDAKALAKEIGADGYAKNAIFAFDMPFRLIDAPIAFKSGRGTLLPNNDPF
jgi:hypothetical protein